MKKFVLSFLMACALVSGVQANTGGIVWDKAPNNLNDMSALQNGAKVFVNYCLNCHAAAFMRFTTDKVGDTMKVAMDPRQAKDWFGGNPPDLTVIARSRSASGKGSGADYIYTYLRTYYVDDTKATGWNNLAFPNVGMPHVLWELQGKRAPIYAVEEAHGHEVEVFKGWEQITPGKMTALEYDHMVGDLVGYLQWMSEPSQSKRVQIGVWVLIFLGVLTAITWRLNAAYWKDVK